MFKYKYLLYNIIKLFIKDSISLFDTIILNYNNSDDQLHNERYFSSYLYVS